MGKIAFVFPGQGAQVPGMGLSADENSAAAKEIFDKADAIRPGTSKQCFEGTPDELKITANTQCCLYAVESALAAALTEQGIKADMCAGVSLGELTALYYAGAMDFGSGMKLVMKRGQLMQEDAEKADTFMAAIIRLPQDKLMEIISRFENVYAVNFNGGGQITVAGAAEHQQAFSDAVKEAGGLYILGTERHESRRIDNQLRGRSGRQGDEGESCFFLSVEDDLMRIFAGDRLENLMRRLNVAEDMPIESQLLTRIIESSQKKVEGNNFSIRKNVLNYDDVMNTQREIIYKQRAQVLDGEDLHESILKMMEDLIDTTVDSYIVDADVKDEWNLVGLKDHFLGWLIGPDDLAYTEDDLSEVSKEDITNALKAKAGELYQAKEAEYGSEVMRELERVILLKVVDTKWMAHIDDMEELKKGISLRSYGQKNPVIEYRYEGFEMFDAMVEAIREDTIRMLLTVKLQRNEAPEREQVAKPDAPNAGAGDGSFSEQAKSKHKVGDNDPCPCGSGKKYKKCCKNKEA